MYGACCENVRIRSNKIKGSVEKGRKKNLGKSLKGLTIESFTFPKGFADTSSVLAATSGIFYHHLVHRGPEKRLSATKMSQKSIRISSVSQRACLDCLKRIERKHAIQFQEEETTMLYFCLCLNSESPSKT